VAQAVAPAAALEARRPREPQRLHARDRAVLGRQRFTPAGLIVILAYFVSLRWSIAAHGSVHLHLHPLWLAVSIIFVAERFVTVRARGPLQMALAATLLVEMPFDRFLQVVNGKAILETLTNSERKW
jgi:hypothetical protein